MFGFELWKFNFMMLGLALPPLFLRGYCRWLPCVVFVKSGAVGWGYPYYSTIRSLLGCQNSLFLFLRIADRIISLSCVCWYRGGACFPSPRFVGELVGDLRPSLKLFMTPTVFSGSVTENLAYKTGRCSLLSRRWCWILGVGGFDLRRPYLPFVKSHSLNLCASPAISFSYFLPPLISIPGVPVNCFHTRAKALSGELDYGSREVPIINHLKTDQE